MTDQHKRILHKLYLTFLGLSIFVATATSAWLITVQIHDTALRTDALKCYEEQQDKVRAEIVGPSYKPGEELTENQYLDSIQKIMDKDFIRDVSFICGIFNFSNAYYLEDAWWIDSVGLHSTGLGKDRQAQLFLFLILWALPVMLIASRRWLIWLLK